MTAKAKAKAAPAKKAEKTPMEIGVLAMLRPNTNPFKAIADFGLKTAQVQCWDMSLLNEKFAKETKKQMDDTGVRMAAYWAGYTGRIVWNSYDGPVTCGLVPRDLRARRVDELKRGADFAKMLGVTDVFVRSANKVEVLERYMKEKSLSKEQVVYMGDDLPDYPVMKMVGLPVCPADASQEIKDISLYISNRNGGKGAVRDIIEQVLKSQDKWMKDFSCYIW